MNIIELESVLAWLSNEVEPEMQISTLRVLLLIAMKGKCAQSDIEQELGISNAAASRNVSYWTDRRADRKPGLGFVTRHEDDYDRRYKVLTLSKKGVSFIEKLRSAK
jgi:DNA-binding MarR family transcriptional regulator